MSLQLGVFYSSDLALWIQISTIFSQTRQIPCPGVGFTGFLGTKNLSFFNYLMPTW
jgi:hypothetical protein